MPTYKVTVRYTKYPDHPCMQAYEINAPNYHDAEKEARQKYAQDWGFDFDFIQAYTPDKHLIDYKATLEK